MDKKNIFLSKTFWANIAGLTLTVAGVLPAKYAAPAMAVANVVLRFLSNQPVYVFQQNSNSLKDQ